jgi:hypothetical protein
MSAIVIGRAGRLIDAAGMHCTEAVQLRDSARASRTDALIIKVRAQQVRRARSINGGAPDGDDGDPRCAVCGKDIRTGTPVGNVGGELAHLACWLENRQGGGRPAEPDIVEPTRLAPDSPAAPGAATLSELSPLGRIAAIIVERPVCLACIAAKADTTELDALRVIEHIQDHVKLTIRHGEECRICGSRIGSAYSIRDRS